MANAGNTTAPTQFIETKLEKYAYRRFGKGNGLPLLCLQHFTGTLDNWDPAVTDPLAVGREVILFESAGLGRSTGQVPENMAGMAAHALAFVDALGLKRLDILGYSLGGMVAQQVALERPSLVHKMLLVATAPEGGEDIMHMDKPELRKITEDPNMPGLEKLVKLFFAPSESSQAAGEAFAARLVIGNPLVMKEMAKHVPDAGSYAPVTVLVDEREDGVHLSYDKMVSFLSPYANQDALTIAHDLDHKIVKLLNDAAVE
jgi:pimeloyl-ACP methyl ester carboxylesterase